MTARLKISFAEILFGGERERDTYQTERNSDRPIHFRTS